MKRIKRKYRGDQLKLASLKTEMGRERNKNSEKQK